MSEENKVSPVTENEEESTLADAEAALEGVEPITITRTTADGRTVSLVFKPAIITKKERAGEIYFRPDAKTCGDQALKDFYGEEQYYSYLQQKINLVCQSAARIAETDDGELDQDKLVTILSTGSVRGESKAELMEQRNRILTEVLPSIYKKQQAALDSKDPAAITKIAMEAMQAMADIASLNKEIDAKSREFKPRKKRTTATA